MHPLTRIVRLIACAVATVAICPLVHAAPRQYRLGTLVDTGEYDWCHHDCAPFDRPTFFFCVRVSNQILVGSRKADWIWVYDTSKILAYKGKTVSVRFNHGSIWIVRPNGKDVQLTQDYSRDVFTNLECTAEVHRHWLQQDGNLERPSTVPANATLVPEGAGTIFKREGPHFWIACSFDAQADWNVCEVWDKNGVKLKQMRCIDSTGSPVPSADLAIDPLTTRVDYEIHLKSGAVLKPLR